VGFVELVRRFGEMNILMGFSGVIFVELVRRFGEMKILIRFMGVRFVESETVR
jgi:hypothetical protein